MRILVTGSAGFIGMHTALHTALRLLQDGHDVVGIDNPSPHFDVGLQQARLAWLSHPCFGQIELDLVDAAAIRKLFEREQFGRVVHLPAQPGVRGIARFVARYKAHYHP